MPHPLVVQLRFTRSELVRCIEGVSDDDARRRLLPMNCISWIVGHLADHENSLWVRWAQGKTLLPELRKLVGYGQPASTPPLAEMWAAWRTITAEADLFLDTVTPAVAVAHMEYGGKRSRENVGTALLHVMYHYWFHLGEAYAVRQMLGHVNLPEFIADMTGVMWPGEGPTDANP